ncbi:MAG: hypothetical protein V7707_08680 [Motiliproteus sp.]
MEAPTVENRINSTAPAPTRVKILEISRFHPAFRAKTYLYDIPEI